MALSKSQRKVLFSMFGGHCAYCGCVLPEKGWHADHKEPVVRELEYVSDDRGYGRYRQTGRMYRPEHDNAANFFPACAKCNIDKGAGTIEDFRNGLRFKITTLRRYNASFQHAERFGLVSVSEEPVVFYFERYLDKTANRTPTSAGERKHDP